MNASVDGLLRHFNKYWSYLEHKGKPLEKEQARAILEHCRRKRYKYLSECPDSEIEYIIDPPIVEQKELF